MSEEIDLDTGRTRAMPDSGSNDNNNDHVDNKKKESSSHTNNNKKRARNRIVDGRVKFRKGLTPYLPPPVVNAMNKIDPLLEPYVGPEASITIASSLFLCFILVQVMKVLSSISRGGKAIADDDDDDSPMAKLNKADDYGDTVILVGAMASGKTRIFYQLIHGDNSLPTVMSLRANAALLPVQNKEKPVRVLDYPGHAGLQDELFMEMLTAKPLPRIVLVVDSTQHMSHAADILYDLFQHAKDMNETKFDVFVACHKSDLSTSKNPRRVKIQLRTELEKLIQVRSSELENSSATDRKLQDPWWKKGESLDMDDAKYARLRFEATTCNVRDGIEKVIEFAKTGATE